MPQGRFGATTSAPSLAMRCRAPASRATALGLIAAPELKRGERGIAAAAAALGVPLVLMPKADLEAAGARAQTQSERVLAMTGVPSVAEAAALAAAGPRRAAGRAARRGRDRDLRTRGQPESGHDGAFHRRGAGRCGSHHGPRPRSARALSGLPLCRLDRAAGAAGVVSGRRANRRHRADDARRDRGRVSSQLMRPDRTWRGFIPAIFRSSAPSPSRSAGSSGTRIPYTLTPGVPAFAAAAAVLGRELTVPEIAQSVVLTRVPGRASAMPAGERLRRIRRDRRDARYSSRHSSHRRDRRRADTASTARNVPSPWWRVRPGRTSASCAARLRDIRAKLAAEPIERTALVLVGRALAAQDFRESALYDPDYRRRFRGEGGRERARDCAMTDRSAVAPLRPDVPLLEPGHVWLAGAGPGDPGLLTLDALAGLAQADVIVHDALVDRRVLALAGPQARLEFAGKRGGRPSAAPGRHLQALDRACARAASACCGSRAATPACSAAAARRRWRSPTPACRTASSRASPRDLRGWPRRRSRRHSRRQPGRHPSPPAYGADDDGFDWAALARTGQPIVLYMAMRNLEPIADELMRGGLAAGRRRPRSSSRRPRPRSASSSPRSAGSRPMRSSIGCGTPSIIVIGEIVTVRERLLDALARRRASVRDDRARPHRRGSAFGRRQDHGHARASRRAEAQGHRRARGEGRPRLHRSRVSRRGDRRARVQSRHLGDAAAAARLRCSPKPRANATCW